MIVCLCSSHVYFSIDDEGFIHTFSTDHNCQEFLDGNRRNIYNQ